MIDYPINPGRTTKRKPEIVQEGSRILREECGHHPGDQCDRRFPSGGFLHDVWFVAHTRES